MQMNSLDYGLSLLVSDIGMINGEELLKEKIPINIYDAI